jgi:hypothetical protein
MNWTRFALALLASGILMSLSDWLFMGVLFHNKYKDCAEIWRDPPGSSETKKIMWSTLLGFISAAVFLYLAWRWDFESYEATLKLAAAIWVIGPLPVIITNALWTKFPKELVFSHSLGWLVRLCIVAVAYKLILI